jgi:hypothetical protein
MFWFGVNLLVLAMGTLRLAMVAPLCEYSHGQVFFRFSPLIAFLTSPALAGDEERS